MNCSSKPATECSWFKSNSPDAICTCQFKILKLDKNDYPYTYRFIAGNECKERSRLANLAIEKEQIITNNIH